MSALSDALNEANVENWSAREVARRGDDRIHFATIAKYLAGRHGRPSEDVLEVFSEVLNVPLPRLRELAELPAGDEQPYEPPREANRLDKRQRRLVDELIRMLAEAKVGEGDAEKARRYDAIMGQGNLVEIFSRLNANGVRLSREEIDRAYESVADDLHEDLAARRSTD